MSEMVLVAKNAYTRTQGQCYHTSPECPHADRGEMREVSRDHASDVMGLSECPSSKCGDRVNKSHPGPHLHAHVDDLDLDLPPLDGDVHE